MKWVAFLAFAGCLVGCGGDDGLFTIQIPIFINSNGDLDPNFASAPAGSKVIVVNHDDTGHNVSFGDPLNSGSFLNPEASMTVHMPSEPGIVSVSVGGGGGGSISVF
jgi:hypothetical protein